MTGRLFSIKRFAVHDGPGIRTTVFFRGCPLRCLWCHNPEGLDGEKHLAFFPHECTLCGACEKTCPNGAHRIRDGVHKFDRALCKKCGACEKACPSGALRFFGEEKTVEELLPLLLEDKPFFDASRGGVTLSGGECLLQAPFCARLLKKCKENGVHTAVDTSGAVPAEAFRLVLPYTDLFLYDLKAASSDAHRRLTGCGNERILENLRFLAGQGAKIEIRVPVVPEANGDEMPAVARLAASIAPKAPVRLLPFHDLSRSRYEALGMATQMPRLIPGKEEMARLAAVFEKEGLCVLNASCNPEKSVIK